MKIPRIMIAGTNSGCGKTIIATGIMSVLHRKGLKVQPYKVGPDYLDPMFHHLVTGRSSYNLDAWLLDQVTLRGLFLHHADNADIAVIEGVMGFYDGWGGTSTEASSAHVARMIQSPVLLVVNAAGMALSIAALIKGYQEFVPENGIRAILLNNLKSEGHYLLLKKIIEEHNGIKVIGYLPSMKELSLPSRHLGLIPQDEQADLGTKIDLLVNTMERTIDFNALLEVAHQAEDLDSDFQLPVKKVLPVKIGVARDQAFNFYYQDNLELLEQLGASLVFFSPLNDTVLPVGISGLYLGGGYPEVFAQQLQENHSMKTVIKDTIEMGIPAYAECGGMMYLGESIIDHSGAEYEMCGVFPVHTEMTTALQRFGYVTVNLTDDTVLGHRGMTIRAHEFHYSQVQPRLNGVQENYCYQIGKPKPDGTETSWTGGLKTKNALVGYPHLHFWSNPQWAETFVEKCSEYQRSIECRKPDRS